MWAIATIFGRVEVMIGASEMWGENLAQRPVYGDVIILQVGVNGEADLQISHTWIIANYQIIQEASFLAPLDHPHIINTQMARKRGDPVSPRTQAPHPISDSILSSVQRVSTSSRWFPNHELGLFVALAPCQSSSPCPIHHQKSPITSEPTHHANTEWI